MPFEDAVTRLTGNNGGLFTKTTATGLALLLLLSILPSCAARHMPDWSRVQAVPPKTKTDVHLYKDEAHQGSRKIKGRFDSAAADSITLKLKDGQTRTLEKQAVRKVLTPLPFRKRGAGWATLLATSVLVGVLLMALGTDGAEPGEVPLMSASVIGPPTLAAFLVAKMGSIYDVPPKHRTRTQGAKQSGVQDKAPGKPKDHPRRD